MTVNFVRIDEAIAFAERAQSNNNVDPITGLKWDQGTWMRAEDTEEWQCGTACCIAGYLSLADGYVPAGQQQVKKDGAYASPSIVAANIVGLSIYDADPLFSATNTVDDLKRVRDQLAKKEGVPTRYDN